MVGELGLLSMVLCLGVEAGVESNQLGWLARLRHLLEGEREF